VTTIKEVQDELVLMLREDVLIQDVSVDGNFVFATPRDGDMHCRIRFRIGESNGVSLWLRREERPEQIVMSVSGHVVDRYETKSRTFRRLKSGTYNWGLIADRIDECLDEFVIASEKRKLAYAEAERYRSNRQDVVAKLRDMGVMPETSKHFMVTTQNGISLTCSVREDGRVAFSGRLDVDDFIRMVNA
jgi:hypothetical protein